MSTTEPNFASSNPAAVRKNNSVHFRGEESRRVYLEVVDGHPVDCLLDTGSEVTLIPGNLVRELPKKPITSQIRAANGTIIEMLGLVDSRYCCEGKNFG